MSVAEMVSGAPRAGGEQVQVSFAMVEGRARVLVDCGPGGVLDLDAGALPNLHQALGMARTQVGAFTSTAYAATADLAARGLVQVAEPPAVGEGWRRAEPSVATHTNQEGWRAPGATEGDPYLVFNGRMVIDDAGNARAQADRSYWALRVVLAGHGIPPVAEADWDDAAAIGALVDMVSRPADAMAMYALAYPQVVDEAEKVLARWTSDAAREARETASREVWKSVRSVVCVDGGALKKRLREGGMTTLNAAVDHQVASGLLSLRVPDQRLTLEALPCAVGDVMRLPSMAGALTADMREQRSWFLPEAVVDPTWRMSDGRRPVAGWEITKTMLLPGVDGDDPATHVAVQQALAPLLASLRGWAQVHLHDRRVWIIRNREVFDVSWEQRARKRAANRGSVLNWDVREVIV